MRFALSAPLMPFSRLLFSMVLFSTTLPALVCPAEAAELAGVTFPDRVDVGGETLSLNGLGLREATIFAVDVYVAGLYLRTPSGDATAIIASKEPKRMVLHFVRDVDKDDIQEAWSTGFKNAADFDSLRERIDKFNSVMTGMRVGEKIVLDFREGSVRVTVGGGEAEEISGEDFARGLLSIWLGSSPPNAGLKRGLLGG